MLADEMHSLGRPLRREKAMSIFLKKFDKVMTRDRENY
jgi:hypothetical protein